MYGEIHILVGIALQQAGGDCLAFSIPCSVLSHPVIDSLNWSPDADSLYHGLGTGRAKWLAMAVRIPIVCILIWWLIGHPSFLICGLIAWLCWDWEHGFRVLFHRDLKLHQRMYPKWLKSEAGVILVLIGMIVLMGLVMT